MNMALILAKDMACSCMMPALMSTKIFLVFEHSEKTIKIFSS